MNLIAKSFTGGIDFDPLTWETYYKFDNNFIVDNSFNDASKWTGSNFSIASGKVSHSGASLDVLNEATPINAVVGKKYRIIWDNTSDFAIDFGGVSVISGKVFTAISTAAIDIITNTDGAEMEYLIAQEATTIADATRAIIGYLPHLFFNRLCTTGNVYGYPEIWDGDTVFNSDTNFSNVYLWSDISEAYILAHLNTAYIKYYYQYFISGALKNGLFYIPQRTNAQNNILKLKKYTPNY